MDLSFLSNPVDKWLPPAANGNDAANLSRMRLANMYGQRSQDQQNRANAPHAGDVTGYFGPPPTAVDNLVRNRAESAALKELDTVRSTGASTPSPIGAGFGGPGLSPDQKPMVQGMAQAGISPRQYAQAILAKGHQMSDGEDPQADAFNFNTPQSAQ